MQKELDFEYNELFTPFEWSYSPYTKMWYEDNKENIPEFPIQNNVICNSIEAYLNLENSFNSKNNTEKEFSKYIDYLFGKTGSGNDCFDTTFIFSYVSSKSNNKEKVCVSNDNLPLLKNFINNIKQCGCASIYIESFSGVKLFAWEYSDKIHFVIQDYKLQKYNKTDNANFKILLNALVDKDMFYKKLTSIINKYKQKCKTAIIDYQNGHKEAKLSNYNKHFIDWVLS